MDSAERRAGPAHWQRRGHHELASEKVEGAAALPGPAGRTRRRDRARFDCKAPQLELRQWRSEPIPNRTPSSVAQPPAGAVEPCQGFAWPSLSAGRLLGPQRESTGRNPGLRWTPLRAPHPTARKLGLYAGSEFGADNQAALAACLLSNMHGRRCPAPPASPPASCRRRRLQAEPPSSAASAGEPAARLPSRLPSPPASGGRPRSDGNSAGW